MPVVDLAQLKDSAVFGLVDQNLRYLSKPNSGKSVKVVHVTSLGVALAFKPTVSLTRVEIVANGNSDCAVVHHPLDRWRFHSGARPAHCL